MSCDNETIHTECVTGAKNRAEITVVGRAVKQRNDGIVGKGGDDGICVILAHFENRHQL